MVKPVRKTINVAEFEDRNEALHKPLGVTEVLELVVGPRRGIPSCEAGDSGSLMMNEAGHVVGHLWGRSHDDSIVTDVRVVFEAIREKLGLGPGTIVDIVTKFP